MVNHRIAHTGAPPRLTFLTHDQGISFVGNYGYQLVVGGEIGREGDGIGVIAA
jgi:hypothetical protein